MSHAVPLVAAAAGVGFGHAILPDHWVPLAVLGRTRRYSLTRVARLSGLAGVAHVLVSTVLGAVIIVVGLQFRSTVQSAQDAIIGCLLMLTGLGFAVMELTGHGHAHAHEHHAHAHAHEHHTHEHHAHAHAHEHHAHEHHAHAHAHEHHTHEHHAHAHGDHEHGDHAHGDHEHDDHTHEHGQMHELAAIMVPFGAAASPDLTILPVFLAATAAGAATAIVSLLAFATATIGTIVVLTLFACFGGYQVQGQWLERWGNAFTALILVAIGALVFTGIL